MFRVRHDHYFHVDPDDGDILQQILDRLNAIGDTMSDLSIAFDAMKSRVDTDVAELIRQAAAKDTVIADQAGTIADLGSQLTTALANDVADAATIAAKQTEIQNLNDAAAATLADEQAVTAAMASVDPLADFPAPPAEG